MTKHTLEFSLRMIEISLVICSIFLLRHSLILHRLDTPQVNSSFRNLMIVEVSHETTWNIIFLPIPVLERWSSISKWSFLTSALCRDHEHDSFYRDLYCQHGRSSHAPGQSTGSIREKHQCIGAVLGNILVYPAWRIYSRLAFSKCLCSIAWLKWHW